MAGAWGSVNATLDVSPPVGLQPNFFLVASPPGSWTQNEGLWASNGGTLLPYRGTENSTVPYGIRLVISDGLPGDGRITVNTTKGSYVMVGALEEFVTRIFDPDEVFLSIVAPTLTAPNSTRMQSVELLFRDIDTYLEEGGMSQWSDIIEPTYWSPSSGGMQWISTAWTYNAGAPGATHSLVSTPAGAALLDAALATQQLISVSLQNSTELFEGSTKFSGYDNNVEALVFDLRRAGGLYYIDVISPDGSSGGIDQIRLRNADLPPPVTQYWTQYRNTFEGAV